MNKSEFIAALEEKLQSFPPAEKQKSISYFQELIEDRVEDGMTEEEAVASMEPVHEIAEKIILEMPLTTVIKARIKPKEKLSTASIVCIWVCSPFWLPIALAFVCVFFAIFISIWAVIFALATCVFAFLISGIAMLLLTPINFASGAPVGILSIGMALAALGLGLLLFFPVKAMVQSLVNLTKWVFMRTKSLFIKKEVA